jgi:hypothetical protein
LQLIEGRCVGLFLQIARPAQPFAGIRTRKNLFLIFEGRIGAQLSDGVITQGTQC